MWQLDKIHRVGETCLTSLNPVLDVMPIDVVFVGTARKSTALVSGFQGSSHRRCFALVFPKRQGKWLDKLKCNGSNLEQASQAC